MYYILYCFVGLELNSFHLKAPTLKQTLIEYALLSWWVADSQCKWDKIINQLIAKYLLSYFLGLNTLKGTTKSRTVDPFPSKEQAFEGK